MNKLQPSSKKRKRSESTQSCESGVSVLSSIGLQSEHKIELQDDDEVSETSRLSACTTECLKTSPSAITHVRKMKANVIEDSQVMKTKRTHSLCVSCSCCDEDAQTLVKELEFKPTANDEHMYSDRQCNRNFTSVNTSTCRCNCPQEDQKEKNQTITSANQFARNILTGTQMSRPTLERSCDHHCGRTNEKSRRENKSQFHGCDSSSLFTCHHSFPHLYESLPQLPIDVVHRHIPEQSIEEPHPEMQTSSRYQRRSKSRDVLREVELGIPASLNNKNNVNQRSPETFGDVYFEHSIGQCNKGERNIAIGECIQEKFTKNWLYILLILNIVIIGFNVENFLRNKEQHEHENAENAFCMQCSDLKHILGNNFRKYQLRMNGKEECCLNSLSQLLSLISNIANSSTTPQAQAQTQAEVATCYEDIPIVQYKAINKKQFEDKTRISWEIDPDRPVQRGFGQLDTHTLKTTIVIPQSGIYYVYLRIHHKRSGSQSNKPFDIGYSILKNNDVTIDSFDQNCTPGNSSSSHVDHTNHLASLQNLTTGDKIYVILTHPDLFEISNTKLGLILVS